MAQLKLSDTLRRLNTEYDAELSYQRLYLAVAAGLVPAERDPSGRFWLIDEADQPHAARVLGIIPAKPKTRSAAKASTNKRSRSGSSRPAA